MWSHGINLNLRCLIKYYVGDADSDWEWPGVSHLPSLPVGSQTCLTTITGVISITPKAALGAASAVY